jgi:hypothetical protein
MQAIASCVNFVVARRDEPNNKRRVEVRKCPLCATSLWDENS